MLDIDFKNEAVKALPPVVVSGCTLFGIELNDWVVILTILYIFIQCVALSFRIHRDQCIFKFRMQRLYDRRKEDKKMPVACSIHKISEEEIGVPPKKTRSKKSNE
jgi:hypothetical protein